MLKNEIIRVLNDFYELGIPGIIRRHNEIHTVKKMASVLTGARRAGKSSRTLQFAQDSISSGKVESIKNIAWFDFDNPIFANMTSHDLHIFEEVVLELNPSFNLKTPIIFIFDEIHKINGWENYIVQLSRNLYRQVLVTGSSSKLLKEDIATELRGKSISTKIHPLSFKEYIHFKNEKVSKSTSGIATRRRLFDEYLKWGSFPEIPLVEEQTRTQLLREYFDTMMLKDLIQRHRISKPHIAIKLLQYINSNISRPQTLVKLYSYIKNLNFKTSKDSLKNYIEQAIDSHIFSAIHFFSDSIKDIEKNYTKYYSVDWALATKNSSVWDGYYSRSFENLIYQELNRRDYRTSYYITKTKRKEVDFITMDQNGNLQHLIQASMNIESPDTLDRELEPLITAGKYFKPKECLLITLDSEQTFKQDGITINAIPAWKWLTE